MTQAAARTPAPRRAGIGLRLAHLADIASARPDAGWLEVHPENFLANPHATELLEEIAATYPVSIHTVGVSVGSAHGIDRAHLERVKRLVQRFKPFLVSGHLAWSTHPGEYLNDLLPLPYDDETLDSVSRHIDIVQQAIGQPYVLENPSTYVGFRGSTMTEPAFLTRVVERTGCQLLCDVSNVHVSAHNMGYDAYAYIDEMPADAIAEMHLGGFTIEDESAGTVLIDTHDQAIADPAWALYAYALRRIGWRPTLIEWDSALPPVATLLAEARRAEAIAADVLHPTAERRLAAR